MSGRTHLLVRFFILVAVAAAPAAVDLFFLKAERTADRLARLREDVVRQAELVSADIDDIVDAARQLTEALGHSAPSDPLDATCAESRVALRAEAPRYTGLAVVAQDGRTICATDDEPGTPTPSPLAKAAASAIQSGHFEAGAFVPSSQGHFAQLPFASPFTAANGGRGAVVAGLSLDWLRRHLANLPRAEDGTTTLASRDGAILVRLPDQSGDDGRTDASAANPANAERGGTAVLTGYDGIERLVGYAPVKEPAAGLYVAAAYPLRDMTPVIQSAMRRGSVLVGLGALLAALLALLMAERYFRRPTRVLVDAARRWSSGDMTPRASLGRSAAVELSSLAAALNAMASAFHCQRSELQDVNRTLEARLDAQAHDLDVARGRLRVEVAQREKTETSLQQAQKLQAIGQLAGGIAHDFNNMLTAVTGGLELLRRRMPPGNDNLLKLVADAQSATERGGRLTAQLLAFARRQRLLPAPTDLNAVVECLCTLLESTLERASRLRTTLEPRLWPAMVDQAQVEAAILNLALNARDAIETGGALTIATTNVTLGPNSAARAARRVAPGDYVAVSVSDTGCGMSSDILPRVFEPFFTTKPPGRGSGLGLSQVHGLAVQSGGDVEVESQEGRGTRVTLLLPRARIQAAASANLSDTDQPRSGTARVLIVDDDQDVRGMVGEMLQDAGYAVTLACAADEALALLATDAVFDLMLADYAMPGMNGVTLLHHARQHYPDLRALLVTGFAEFRAAEALGPDQIVRKPFTISTLVGRVEKALAEPTRR